MKCYTGSPTLLHGVTLVHIFRCFKYVTKYKQEVFFCSCCAISFAAVGAALHCTVRKYRVSTKELYTFKIIQKTTAAYL
jgi:hypothetical protein